MEKTRISLKGEFSADDLDEIIRTLARVRSGMQPPIASVPPGAHSPEGQEVLIEAIDSLVIRRLTGGRLRFYLRNSGLGWLAHEVSAEAAEGLAHFLSNEFADQHTLQ